MSMEFLRKIDMADEYLEIVTSLKERVDLVWRAQTAKLIT